MAGITHSLVSAKSQGSDPTKVSKNEWNDEHMAGAYDAATAPVTLAATDATSPEKAMSVLSGTSVCDGTGDFGDINTLIGT